MQAELGQQSYAEQHLRELARVGSHRQLNIVVHYRDSLRYSQWFVMNGAAEQPRPLHSMNPGRRGGELLDAFLTWALDEYPAEQYLLVLWGHSYGIRFGHGDTDAITIVEIADALNAFAERRRDRRLELLGFSSCTMSYAEALYELRQAAELMIAPQGSMPLEGWPLASIVSALKRKPSIASAQCATEIAHQIVRARAGVAMTLVDLRRAETLATRLQEFTHVLRAKVVSDNGDRPMLTSINAAFRGAARSARVRPLIDIVDLCTVLARRSRDRRVHHAAARLKATLRHGRNRLIRAHVSSQPQRGMHGVSVYARHVTDGNDWESLKVVEDSYNDLAFNRLTGWNVLVDTLAAGLEERCDGERRKGKRAIGRRPKGGRRAEESGIRRTQHLPEAPRGGGGASPSGRRSDPRRVEGDHRDARVFEGRLPSNQEKP